MNLISGLKWVRQEPMRKGITSNLRTPHQLHYVMNAQLKALPNPQYLHNETESLQPFSFKIHYTASEVCGTWATPWLKQNLILSSQTFTALQLPLAKE